MSTILCIDDEPVVCAALERQITGLGHDPLVVASFEEALRGLARRSVDLVISDCPTPGAAGLDLPATLHERGIDVPVILMAPYSCIELAANSTRRGAVDYLSKPLRAETLRMVVAHGLEVSRLRRENERIRREIDELRGRAPINLRELERIAIDRALIATGGHRTRAAGLLGISERTLRNKLNSPSTS